MSQARPPRVGGGGRGVRTTGAATGIDSRAWDEPPAGAAPTGRAWRDPDLLAGLPSEGARIVAETIARAFAGVSRQGGVSWSESVALNGVPFARGLRRSPVREISRRELDRARGRSDLVVPRSGVGGFAFLDPIGTRYYLPVAMIRWLRGERTTVSCPTVSPLTDGELREWTLDKWSLLSDAQRAGVARFIRHSMETEEAA